MASDELSALNTQTIPSRKLNDSFVAISPREAVEELESEVSGPAGQVTIDFNVGYGFTAIIVAFLGRLHPVGILLAGLLMALTYIGGDIAQSQLGLPAAAIQVFQGMLLFFLLALDLLTNYRVRFGRAEVA